jgi:hypothetical protein
MGSQCSVRSQPEADLGVEAGSQDGSSSRKVTTTASTDTFSSDVLEPFVHVIGLPYLDVEHNNGSGVPESVNDTGCMVSV